MTFSCILSKKQKKKKRKHAIVYRSRVIRVILNKEKKMEGTFMEQAKPFVLLFIVCLTKPDEDFFEIKTLLH